LQGNANKRRTPSRSDAGTNDPRKDNVTGRSVTIFFVARFNAPFAFDIQIERLNAPGCTRVESGIKQLRSLLPLLVTAGLLVGCSGEIVSNDSTSSATDDSADRSFHDSMDRVNQQAALDAANAAAQQQFNDAMAATQQAENQHNSEFNQNSIQ
jgi:hypothetical protein